jgi:hypothetical protein
MSTSGPLNVLTGTAAAPLDTGYFDFTSPTLQLNSTGTTKLVKTLTQTYFFSPLLKDISGNTIGSAYIQMVFSFELLAALLDSAPTNTGSGGANIFQVAVGTKGDTKGTYVVDAQIQTKGNSAMSPTYTSITVPQTDSTKDGYVYFPVTNFFSVTSPGAPYTLTITLTKVT